MTLWPHIEEAMIGVMGALLDHPMSNQTTGRQVFRSIVSSEARIAIMRSLLEESPFNKTKDIFYDEVLDEFASLNKARNTYAHGIWTTHKNGSVYLAETTTDDLLAVIASPRKIPKKELQLIVGRMKALRMKIIFGLISERRQALSEIQSSQPSEDAP